MPSSTFNITAILARGSQSGHTSSRTSDSKLNPNRNDPENGDESDGTSNQFGTVLASALHAGDAGRGQNSNLRPSDSQSNPRRNLPSVVDEADDISSLFGSALASTLQAGLSSQMQAPRKASVNQASALAEGTATDKEDGTKPRHDGNNKTSKLKFNASGISVQTPNGVNALDPKPESKERASNSETKIESEASSPLEGATSAPAFIAEAPQAGPSDLTSTTSSLPDSISPIHETSSPVAANVQVPAGAAPSNPPPQGDETAGETIAFQGQLSPHSETSEPIKLPQSDAKPNPAPVEHQSTDSISHEPSAHTATATASTGDQHPGGFPRNSGQQSSGDSESRNLLSKASDKGTAKAAVETAPRPENEAGSPAQVQDIRREPDQTNPNASAATNLSSKQGSLPIDQQPASTPQAARNELNLRVQGQSGETITVHVSEKAGEIQLAVRSTDPAAATALRHELPAIKAGLEGAGWQMETSADQQHSTLRSNTPEGHGNFQDRDKNDSNPQWKDQQNRRKPSPENEWADLLN